VGAATEAELEDRKLRIEDAKNATFAAVEEGIVPGGGAALLHLSELVPAFRESLPSEEERLGADIVMKALRAPCRIIAGNAGVEGEVVVQKLLGQPFAIGYNAMTDKVGAGAGWGRLVRAPLGGRPGFDGGLTAGDDTRRLTPNNPPPAQPPTTLSNPTPNSVEAPPNAPPPTPSTPAAPHPKRLRTSSPPA
jgi:hypothetical protein